MSQRFRFDRMPGRKAALREPVVESGFDVAREHVRRTALPGGY